MKAMHELNLLDDANITIYMTGDEENAGEPRSISRGDFIERAKQHDIVLAFEGAAGLNTIATARRGSSGWDLTVEGKQGHSSGVFGSAGYGAIYEAARIVNSFRESLSKEKYLTFNPGIFIGGSEVSASLSYATPQTYIEKIKISPLNPSVQGIPTLYTVDKPLPAGLTLNPLTGSINGTPTKAQDFTDYVITASNSTGYDTFTISIKVLIAFPEIDYPATGVFKQGVPVNFKPTLVGR